MVSQTARLKRKHLRYKNSQGGNRVNICSQKMSTGRFFSATGFPKVEAFLENKTKQNENISKFLIKIQFKYRAQIQGQGRQGGLILE